MADPAPARMLHDVAAPPAPPPDVPPPPDVLQAGRPGAGSPRPGMHDEGVAAPLHMEGEGEGNSIGNGVAGGESGAELGPPDFSSWAYLWQVPSIALSMVLIAAGLWIAMDRTPPPPLAALLDEAEATVIAGATKTEALDAASAYLNEVVKPRLREATEPQRGRFHAIVADWLSLSQQTYDVSLEQNNRHIVEQYGLAEQYGFHLSADRLQRWVQALLDLGMTAEALRRLDQMDVLAAGTPVDAEQRRRRNEALKMLITDAMRHPEASLTAVLALIERLRADQALRPADHAWALARHTEMLLRHDRAHDAVDMLLLEMRRLEAVSTVEGTPAFGRLYVWLGQAYFDVREDRQAEHQFQLSLQMLGSGDADRGRALTMLGRIEQSRGNHQEAFEHYDEVVRDYSNTAAELPARLGRAEVLSILGEHERSIDEYQQLGEALLRTTLPWRIDTGRLAMSLIDRHDASLANGQLETALRYAAYAERLFSGRRDNPVPAQVLFRIASTNRQLADNFIAEAGHDLSPEIRHEANQHFRTAGDYYARHAEAVRGEPAEDDTWADSLWMAADSYDRAGWYELAVRRFAEYRNGRSGIDPRYSEAGYRLGVARLAARQPGEAIVVFEEVIEQSPRSPAASKTYVPLARAYAQVDRPADSRLMLEQVLRGERYIDPDAVDYRHALIEYGRLQYEAGAYIAAIEHLDDAAQRYPNDAQINEVRYWLGDSYRLLGRSILSDDAHADALPMSERRALEQQRDQYLRRAMTLFSMVWDGYSRSEPERLNMMQRDFQRLAALYRGDCAFELGEYELAVQYYDQAARSYNAHHASLVALVQVVNCYYAMGDADRARTAEQRARVRLQQLPDDVFDSADSLMDRTAWERWLANSPPGMRPGLNANAGS